jgi:hypothetical protein
VQSARPYRGSDKGWIERLFRTLRERLLESLPGYTGPNVLARGKDVEADAVYFTHELEAIIGRWIALDYQRRPHDGLRVPEAPHLTLSPNEAYEEAIARTGFLYVPRDPDLHLRLLPVEARVIGRSGVEIAGLTYDSPALDPYRQRHSPLGALDGKWPVRVDRRDLGRVWFQDPRDERFHELSWRHAREVARPFGASALCYIKRLLVESGMRRPSEEEIATRLARLLHELSDEDLFRDRRARREAIRQAVIAEQRRDNQSTSRRTPRLASRSGPRAAGQHPRLPRAHRPHLGGHRRDPQSPNSPTLVLARHRNPPPPHRPPLRPPLPTAPRLRARASA